MPSSSRAGEAHWSHAIRGSRRGNRCNLFLGSQDQTRGGLTFNSNPSALFGTQNLNRIYQVNWTQNLSKSTERALALDASFSYQQDRFTNSPLTPGSELGTRNKFGGFMIAPLEFVFDHETFPIDSALIADYRANTPGTRRSPFDLENTDQYRLADEYRNSPYALLGNSERGGPGGTVQQNRENRLIGKAAVDWQFDRYNRLKFGGEYTRYHTINYSHNVVSQAFANA